MNAPPRLEEGPHHWQLAGAVALLSAFVLNEQRHRNPLAPVSSSGSRAWRRPTETGVISMAGSYSMFLHRHPVHADRPALSPRSTLLGLRARHRRRPHLLRCHRSAVRAPGTRPVIVGWALISAGAMYLLFTSLRARQLLGRPARTPVHHVARARVCVRRRSDRRQRSCHPTKPGLADAVINTSFQLGSALDLAIFFAIATSRTPTR